MRNDSKRKKQGKMVTLSACMNMCNDSEHQNGGNMVTLNAELNNDSKCQNEDVALNVKLKNMTTLNVNNE